MKVLFSSSQQQVHDMSISPPHSTAPVADAWTLPTTLPTYRTACQRAAKRRRWWIVYCLQSALLVTNFTKFYNQFLFFFHGEKGAMCSIYTSWLSFSPYHTGVYSCIPEETKKVCMWKCLFVPCVHIKCCKHFHTWFGSEADNYLHIGRTEHNCPP